MHTLWICQPMPQLLAFPGQAVSLPPPHPQDEGSPISRPQLRRRGTCLVQGDATGIIVLGSTGLTLLGPHDTSHAAFLLQVGDTTVPLGYPEIGGLPQYLSSWNPPQQGDRPHLTGGKWSIEKGSPHLRSTARGASTGTGQAQPPPGPRPGTHWPQSCVLDL